jgi:hypothetical protein
MKIGKKENILRYNLAVMPTFPHRQAIIQEK